MASVRASDVTRRDPSEHTRNACVASRPANRTQSSAVRMAVHVGATTSIAARPGTTFSWRVQGVTDSFFTGASSGAAGVLISPHFTALGYEWRVDLYPNGRTVEDAGSVSVFLLLYSPNVERFSPLVVVEIGDKARTLSKASSSFSSVKPPLAGTGQAIGWCKFVSHETLFAAPHVYSPGGVLTVTVSVSQLQFVVTERGTAELQATSASLPPVVPSSMNTDFASLLESGEGADVTLLCGSERISAHSLFLCSRSPVLRAQLHGPLVRLFSVGREF